ncbi:MAG: urease accessory protein UreD [Actinobacteria bacterium]|nr:urease accessory protein UreD [Actinomycetota bacterium]MBV8959553.1 urease accessory protein UreD [Actinomycetota bacterium]MBV9256169.1 urease accessory protein UreD [Actinomycetota bacterium]
MKATARVVAAPGDRLAVLESCPPVALRATPSGVFVVGGAYSPLGGDEVALSIVVEPGASLVVRSAAAAVALPGPSGAPSAVRVTASVGAGGSLVWHPEPGVAAAGCEHHNDAVVSLEAGASLVWREEVVVGRHGEAGGRWTSSLSVDLDAQPLLRHRVELGTGTDWASPAVGGGARCHGSVLIVGDDRHDVRSDARRAVMPLAGPAVLIVATAPDAVALGLLLHI